MYGISFSSDETRRIKIETIIEPWWTICSNHRPHTIYNLPCGVDFRGVTRDIGESRASSRRIDTARSPGGQAAEVVYIYLYIPSNSPYSIVSRIMSWSVVLLLLSYSESKLRVGRVFRSVTHSIYLRDPRTNAQVN